MITFMVVYCELECYAISVEPIFITIMEYMVTTVTFCQASLFQLVKMQIDKKELSCPFSPRTVPH